MDIKDAILRAKKRIAEIDLNLKWLREEDSPTQREVDKPHITNLENEREYLFSLCFFATTTLEKSI